MLGEDLWSKLVFLNDDKYGSRMSTRKGPKMHISKWDLVPEDIAEPVSWRYCIDTISDTRNSVELVAPNSVVNGPVQMTIRNAGNAGCKGKDASGPRLNS